MAEFNFNESTEYLQLKERRQQISNLLYNSSGSSLLASISNIIPTFLSFTQKPSVTLLSAQNSQQNQAKRDKLFELLSSSQFFESRAILLKNETLKDYSLLVAISNYSLAESIFQLDCETEELKKYRSMAQPNEDSKLKMARITRRKAEDTYKNNQYDEAIRLFREADEKFEMDYTVHYQLALIYFFEKADFTEACNYFRKAAKYSQNKSSLIFIASTVFLGLALRLYSEATQNSNLLEEAYNALVQAYSIDSRSLFINYALAQSCVSLMSKSGYAQNAREIIQKIIRANEFYAYQMIYDVAFNNALDIIGEELNALINEHKNNAIDLFKEIDDSLDRVSQQSKYLTNASKVAGIKNEYRLIQEKINHLNYFEAKDIERCSKSILESIQAIFKEVNENRAYFQVRELIEELLKQFNEDKNAADSPLKSLEADLKNACDEYEKLEKSYPPDREETIVKKNVINKGKTEVVEQRVPASISWKKQKLYLLVKTVIGCMFSAIVVISVGTLFMALAIELHPIIYVIFIAFLLFTPMYGAIGGEIYYFNVENRRKRLKDNLDRLEQLINVKKPRVEEEIVKLKTKYSKVIAEKIKERGDNAEQILEVSIKGNFEQIKRFITNA